MLYDYFLLLVSYWEDNFMMIVKSIIIAFLESHLYVNQIALLKNYIFSAKK